MHTTRFGRRSWLVLVFCALMGWATPAGAAETDPRDNASPWGIASGAEWSGEHPRFNPVLAEAGVKWLRYFPEWRGIQPRPGQWNWTRADAFVANCRENKIHVAGVLKGDTLQAEMLVQAYVLSLAQGFDRICWFEARGPAYGHGTDHGIIRPDWSVRTAYVALKTMTMLLGAEPKYLGWLNVGQGGYGFFLKGAEDPVLAAWAPPGKSIEARFDGGITITSASMPPARRMSFL